MDWFSPVLNLFLTAGKMQLTLLNRLVKWITQTKALDECRGPYELAFFEPTHRIFYVTGLSKADRSLGYRLYRMMALIMILVFVSLEIWQLLSEPSNLDDIIDNINVTIIHMITILRYRNMMINHHIYDKLAQAMETEYFDVKSKQRQGLLELWMARNSKFFKLLLGLGTCTLAIWYVYPLMDDVDYNLPVTMRLPFEYQTPHRYAITYPVVLFAFHYISYFVIVNDLFLQTHLMYLICQFSVLADGFENVLKDSGCEDLKQKSGVNQNEFKEKYTEHLSNLVKQHKFIVQNTSELKNILSIPMLCQFMASSMLICFAGYQVTATLKLSISKFLMSLLYLAYNMFNLYIFCRWCDEIKLQSSSIAQAIYSSGWERGAGAFPEVRSRLMIVMIRASKPLVVSAGGLYDLSLESYSTLVKTSYSFLTVLLRVKDD